MPFLGSLLNSFDAQVNVQSISAATQDAYGNFTSWGAIRSIYVREELDEALVSTGTGEAKSTTHRWMAQEAILVTDRVWLAADYHATAPTATKARTPASVFKVTGPGAHWEVRI